MSYSEFDPATEMEAWRARCLKAEQEAAALRQERDSVQRELERWRHGVTVEGDFVCPDSAALADRDQQIAALKSRLGQWEASIPDALNEAGRIREEAVIEQVAVWLEDAAGLATDCADCWRGAAEDLRSGAWRKP